MPTELADAGVGEYTFDSWSVALSEEVTAYLHDLRVVRNTELDALSADEWTDYEQAAIAEYADLRNYLADAIGRPSYPGTLRKHRMDRSGDAPLSTR